jgi:hypothetical protein
MAIFKYTVANKQGKNLNGTVEATDEANAREELNALGFSIISLEQSEAITAHEKGLTKFAFEAIDKTKRQITGTIPAKTPEEALERLKGEYELNVVAIWKENASPEEIEKAKTEGVNIMAKELEEKNKEEDETSHLHSLQEAKEEQITRTKIDFLLKKIHELLVEFGDKIDPDQKLEIERKIDKLLRIKSSTNLEYILTTAKDILKSIQNQEATLQKKGFEGQRLNLKMKTNELLSELTKTETPKKLSEDIINKIENWQLRHGEKKAGLLDKIKSSLKTPVQIEAIEGQIKTYNKQLIEFVKLYFREPTPEYKIKIKNSIKTLWKARKKAKHSISAFKKIQKKHNHQKSTFKDGLMISFLEEAVSLTGWLLFFYILYYFIGLYLQTKDFGFNAIPSGFLVYETQIFKYVLVMLFLLHGTMSLKINFFRKSHLASIILLPSFLLSTIIVFINF